MWIDPDAEANRRGLDLLTEVGVRLARLSSSSELREEEHRDAALLITHFGHRRGGGAAAFDVLDVVRRWPDHPPVVVFASGEHAADNRRALLRRGAWEYASGWQELFQLLQILFGRRY